MHTDLLGPQSADWAYLPDIAKGQAYVGRTPHVVEFFAGCGGAALGLSRAGWHHVACIERAPAAAATLRAAGFPAVEADVRDVDYAPWEGVDLLWASPPCQPGSAAGRRGGARDDRDGWPWTLDALDAVRPTWFLAENVLGWTFHRAGCRADSEPRACVGCYWQRLVVPQVQRRFPFVGWWLMDAADYGVPQRRRRVILWAGPAPLSPDPPRPSHAAPDDADALALGRKPWRTLRDALGDVLLDPETCERRRCYPCDGTHGRACTEPWRLDRPAPTVTTVEEKGTRAHAPAWDLHGGPDRASDATFLVAGIRRVEVEEGLVLQGLPADWPLQGTRHERYVQVGNAVPPPMAQAAGRALALAHRAWGEALRRGLDARALTAALLRHPVPLPTHAAGDAHA